MIQLVTMNSIYVPSSSRPPVPSFPSPSSSRPPHPSFPFPFPPPSPSPSPSPSLSLSQQPPSNMWHNNVSEAVMSCEKIQERIAVDTGTSMAHRIPFLVQKNVSVMIQLVAMNSIYVPSSSRPPVPSFPSPSSSRPPAPSFPFPFPPFPPPSPSLSLSQQPPSNMWHNNVSEAVMSCEKIQERMAVDTGTSMAHRIPFLVQKNVSVMIQLVAMNSIYVPSSSRPPHPSFPSPSSSRLPVPSSSFSFSFSFSFSPSSF